MCPEMVPMKKTSAHPTESNTSQTSTDVKKKKKMTPHNMATQKQMFLFYKNIFIVQKKLNLKNRNIGIAIIIQTHKIKLTGHLYHIINTVKI